MFGVVLSMVIVVMAIALAVLLISSIIYLVLHMYIDVRERSCERRRAAEIRRARSPKKIQDSHSGDIKQRKVAVNSGSIEKRGSKEVRKPDASS